MGPIATNTSASFDGVEERRLVDPAILFRAGEFDAWAAIVGG